MTSRITTPITKHNYLVKDVNELPRVIKEAFFIARTGRPGPVSIDVAADVFNTEFDFVYPGEIYLRGYSGQYIGDEKPSYQIRIRFFGAGVILCSGRDWFD